MDWLIYAGAITTILLGLFFPSLRPERLSFLPKPHLNVDRCVELHNEIVRLGWEGTGRSHEDFRPQTWFEHFGDKAKKARGELSNDLVAFLERAHVQPTDYNLHYYVSGMMYPGDDMFASLDQTCGYEEKLVNMYSGYHRRLAARKLGRFVRLYDATNLDSHPEGLIFDQKTNTAIMCMSIFSDDGLCNDRTKWYPLEDVLAAWLDMIRRGKVKAEPANKDAFHGRKFHPWILLPYTEDMVTEAVDVFNALVEAIETRMPEIVPDPQSSNLTLLDETSLDAAKIPAGFALEFLKRVRRPRFHYIAPGLAIPTPATIANQPFFSVMDATPEKQRHEDRTPPVLLFQSSKLYKRHPSPPTARYELDDILGYPYNASTYPAGLYFHSGDLSGNKDFDDEVVLVLPYGIGENGYARKSDGTLFGEDVNDELPLGKNVHHELYQMGRQPFIRRHDVRLVKVLQSWLAMVESGDWKIGKQGVQQGMNEWKKADTRAGWKKYVVPVDW